MPQKPFYIVDVFAEEKYAGNPLAVVRNGDTFSESEMQRIANEMNYSETTFILSDEPREGGYDVRIFTPKQEVPFAGHPTLGTAYVIRREIVQKPVDEIVLNLKVGPIPVTFGAGDSIPDVLWMKPIEPVFGESLTPRQLAAVLRIDESDVDDRFPVQIVSTGLPFIIVPLKSLAAVRRARIVLDRYETFVRHCEAAAILLFSPETYGENNDLNARMFAPTYGVPEDPATGSANGCLAAWLVKHRYFGGARIDVRVEQGCEIGRRSLLYLRAGKVEEHIEVRVGGKVVMVARGELE